MTKPHQHTMVGDNDRRRCIICSLYEEEISEMTQREWREFKRFLIFTVLLSILVIGLWDFFNLNGWLFG